MSNQKIQPCPKCGGECTAYTYLHEPPFSFGSRRIECETPGCGYAGPCEGSVRVAIIEHNKRSHGATLKSPASNGE